MRRIHALLISCAVAFSVAAGTFAALRTTQLGASSAPAISPTLIARQTAQLRRSQAALERALRRRPPTLPPLPRVTRSPRPPAAAPAPTTTVAPVVTRVVAAPVVHTSSSPAAGRSERDAGGDGGSYDD